MMFRLSIGIMAYNEEAIIGRLLQAILKQNLINGRVEEIIVVASGCTDKTEDIVINFIQQDSRIKLLTQLQREGKASAINLFLANASAEILILASGDIIPEEGTLEKLVAPFSHKSIGMTGAHPVPINSQNTFVGFAVHLLWSLHHMIALREPKLGEMVAFRKIFSRIPSDTAVDEASIEALVKQAGYKLSYASDAIVINKGPENITDFIKQRRRIAAGHLHLLHDQKHQVSTSSPLKILSILLREHSWSIRGTVWTCGAVLLEIIGRMLGYYDYYIKKKNPVIWDIVKSTKRWS
jgi:cellulose synthase/poly-beta-1,6-N-acetylglucosamine synthase-like glycosyltransferase